MPLGGDRVLQLDFISDTLTLICSNMTGKEVLRLNVRGSDLLWETHKRIARAMKVNLQCLRVVLPNGDLLANFCRANLMATVDTVTDGDRKRRRLT